MIKYHRKYFDKRPNDDEFDHKRVSNIQCIVTITSYACVLIKSYMLQYLQLHCIHHL